MVIRQFWDGRWYDDETHPAGPPDDTLGAGAAPPAPAPPALVLTRGAPGEVVASAAPYSVAEDDQALPPRPVLDERRPWKEAGRSTLAQARAYRRQTRRDRPVLGLLPDEPYRQLRDRAAAQRQVARALEPLRAQGYVLLHDRFLAGTSTRLDTLVVGPAGLVVLRVRRVQAYACVQGGWPVDGSTLLRDLAEELDRARTRVLTTVVEQLGPGWSLSACDRFVLLGLDDEQSEQLPGALCTPAQLVDGITALPGALAPLHVSDIAATVERVCPAVPVPAQ